MSSSSLPLHNPHTPSSPSDDAWDTLPPPTYAVSQAQSKRRSRSRFRPIYTLASLLRPRLVRATPRTALLLTCGALVCLWFLSSQLLGPPGGSPLRGPGPPPGPPPPFGGPGIHWPPPPSPPPHAGPHLGGPGQGQDRPAQGPGSAEVLDPSVWEERAERVKQAFIHAYHGYEQYASPKDELLPLSNKSVNNFNGWGVTMVDALDTMYIMGLHDEFERGVKLAETMTFTGENASYVPFFETVIRYLGGLLSAHALSSSPVLLARADELGAALLPAFNTTSGFPMYSVHTRTGETAGGWAGYRTGWLAEVASCMMEFKFLAKLTGKREYFDAAEGVMRTIYRANLTRFERVGGMLPTLWDMKSGQPANEQVSIGALADSAYEYFLKQYLLTNGTDTASRDLYLRTTAGALSHLLYLSPSRSLLYVTDIRVSSAPGTPDFPSRKFEHLSCFYPGLLALGAERLSDADFASVPGVGEEWADEERERHRVAAKGLAVTCGTLYADMPTGLGPDEVVFNSPWEIEWARANRERMEEIRRLKEEAEKLAKELEGGEGGGDGGGVEKDGWEEETTVLPETRTALKREERRNEVYAMGRDLVDGLDHNPDIAGSRGGRTPAPPHNNNDNKLKKLPEVVYPPPVNVNMNTTAEDEKLRWANVVEAWRRGRYDGGRNVWLDEEGREVPKGYVKAKAALPKGAQPPEVDEEERIESVQEMKVAGPPVGPVPGLRDPPLEALPSTTMRDYRSQNSGYYLRPETIESFFVMWRTTHDPVWRERGWAAFLALERETRTESGYAALRNAFYSSSTPPTTPTTTSNANSNPNSNINGNNRLDSMPSYFLAETLKYLYLLFSEDDVIPLDRYVFNTEAHPFPVFEWTEEEKKAFGIA